MAVSTSDSPFSFIDLKKSYIARYSFVPSAKWNASCEKSCAVLSLDESLSFDIYIISPSRCALSGIDSATTTFKSTPLFLPVSLRAFSSFDMLAR